MKTKIISGSIHIKNQLDITELNKYGDKLDTTDYVLLTTTKSGEIINTKDWRTNEHNIVLHSGNETAKYIGLIANKLGLDPKELVLPTIKESEQLYKNYAIRNDLLSKGVFWIPAIVDKENEGDFVSYAQYAKNPEKFDFYYRNINNGCEYIVNPNFNYNLTGIVLQAK